MDILSDRVIQRFYLSKDYYVTPGDYRNLLMNASYSTPKSRYLVFDFLARGGGYYGGSLLSGQINTNFVQSKFFRTEGFLQINLVSLPGFRDDLHSWVCRVRLIGSINLHWSASAFVQYISLDQRTYPNLRIRFNPANDNDLYFVYNDHLNSNRTGEYPVLPVSQTRAIMLKYVHTFQL